MVITQNANERNGIISTMILRNIININWLDYVSNTNVFERANCPSIENIITRTQMRRMGHEEKIDINNDHHLETMRNINTEETSYPS